MLKDVLTILFTPFFTPQPYMSCYGSRISSAAIEPRRQWPTKWRAFVNRVGTKATAQGVSAATRKAIVTVTRRAVPKAMTTAVAMKLSRIITRRRLNDN